VGLRGIKREIRGGVSATDGGGWNGELYRFIMAIYSVDAVSFLLPFWEKSS
jgi:hypothetical protein